jgi:hypothetical protein
VLTLPIAGAFERKTSKMRIPTEALYASTIATGASLSA